MALAFVQTANSGTPSGTATAKTANFGSAQTAGNLNIVAITFGVASGSITVPSITVTDVSGNTYSAIGSFIQHTSGGGSSGGSILYVAKNIAGAAAGANTVTVTLGTAMSYFVASVFEYSGADHNNPVEASSSNFANLPAPTAVSSGNVTTIYGTELLFGFGECFDGPSSIGSGYTQRELLYIAIAGDQVPSIAGTYSFTATSSGTGGWTAWVIALQAPGAPLPPASNISTEILILNPVNTITASEGSPSALQDANSWTFWNTAHAGAWAQVDAGAAVTLTRIRISPQGGGEDLAIGGVIQGSNDPTFATGVNTIYTIGSRPVSGTLLNEYLVSPGAAYRYYRYLTSSATNSGLADLDLIGLYVTGVSGQPVRPVLSPTQAQYDKPTQFSLASITSDATIYYTLDGSTPSSSSPRYTGPLTIGASCTLQAIAISPAGGKSRIISYPVHIGATEVSTDNIFDNRGYRLWALNGNIFYDPVSGYWYRYGVNFDTPGVYAYGNMGNNIYRSPDLRNWEYRGVTMAPGAGGAIGPTNNVYDIAMHVVFNAANNNYVAWTDNWTATSISTLGWNGKKVYTAPSPEGPFTLVQTYSGSVGGYIIQGDFCIFIDTDGVTAYLVTTTNDLNHLVINQLDSAYTHLSGSAFSTYAYASLYPSSGYPGFEAPYLFWNGSTYVLIQSPGESFSQVLHPTFYATSSSALGTYTQGPGNPFQPVPGGNPDYTTSYDSQIWQVLYVPGRNGYIYHGDRYDVVSNNFGASKRIRLPVTFPTSSTLSINWNPAWSFDTQFPSTGSGLPLAVTILSSSFSGGTINLSWLNNEPKAAAIYVDRANDALLSTGLFSRVIAKGATSFSDSQITAGQTYFYQIRTVNANGTRTSILVQVNAVVPGPPPVLAGNPPFLPLVFPVRIPATQPAGGWNIWTGPWEDGPSLFADSGAILYNGQAQTKVIKQSFRP